MSPLCNILFKDPLFKSFPCDKSPLGLIVFTIELDSILRSLFLHCYSFLIKSVFTVNYCLVLVFFKNVCVCVCAESLNCVQLFVIPWTIAHKQIKNKIIN